jgi:UPF0716 family protein affecting phage T7 exclusion
MLLSCVWLIMPGVISDVLALALLVPAVRNWVAVRVTQRVVSAIQQGGMRVATGAAAAAGGRTAGAWPGSPAWPGAPTRDSRAPGVIDVEAELVNPDEPTAGTRRRLEP